MKRIAVVTGANRGLGLEISRQLAASGLRVVLTSRVLADGQGAAKALAGGGLDVEAWPLDVAHEADIEALAAWLSERHGGLDVLVNNAAIALNGFDAEVARRTLEVNFFAPMRLTDRLLPLMKKGGRVVMMSSGLGDRSILSGPLRERFGDDLDRDGLVALMHGFIDAVAAGRHTQEGWPSSAYGVSKLGLNALTHILGRELAADPRGILCNAACPGWVKTRMGGKGAPTPVEEGADTPVWLALLPEGSPQGKLFRNRAVVER